MNQKTIALLTDFGIVDPYVGIMKSVISRIAPDVRLIDLTHLVRPGDIQRGAFILWQAARDFPPETIFLCVIDPGVGTNRKAIYFQSGDKVFIGPDNGLFSYLTFKEEYSAWELSNPDFRLCQASSTFHGRDIFAPAAAQAALGKTGADFGQKLAGIIELPAPALHLEKSRAVGEIISFDRFGNLITSLGQFSYEGDYLKCNSWIDSRSFQVSQQAEFVILINEERLSLKDTFNSFPPGSLAGLVGSTGLLEIAANQDSARDRLEINLGSQVILEWQER
jgi:S-adenosylmethionine hydrolase